MASLGVSFMQDHKLVRSIFFDGKDIAVLGSMLQESDRLVINFSSRINSGKPVLAPAAELYQHEGQNFFYKRRIPTINVICRRNIWWQSEEMFAVLALLDGLKLDRQYKQITTYGLSMGAYGALMFSRALKAHRVIAIAPQYSIDSSKVPFETRWPEDRAQVGFVYDDMAQGLSPDAEVIVLYDRFFEFDKRHIDLLEQHRPVDKFLVNFSTHTVARALNDMGVFSQLMERLFDNDLTKKQFSDTVRLHRHQSPLLLHNMAHTIGQQGRRQQLACELYTRAVRVMQQRLQQQPDYYQQVDRALASIRVLENYTKMRLAQQQLEQADLIRVDELARQFLLPNSYSGWHCIRATAALELGMLDTVQQSLDAIEKYLKIAELNKVLGIYARFIQAKPDAARVEALHQRFERHILRHATASLHMGNMLQHCGLPELALGYFNHVLGSRKLADISINHRQALVGIARCSGLEAALARYEQLLDHNKSVSSYEKIKNTIRRQLA